jgi:hypothetical protein
MTEEHCRLGELSLYERLDILDIILKLVLLGNPARFTVPAKV